MVPVPARRDTGRMTSALSSDTVLVHFAAVSFIFFAAGGVKGVLGMGLPTVAMGLLGLLMPVAEAAALLTVPSLITNLWQAARGGAFLALLRRLWPLLAGVALGSWLGRGWMAPGAAPAATLWLGACLVVYAVAGLSGLALPRPAPRHEGWTGAVAGTLTGLLTAATGVFVLPAVPFLQALGLGKDQLTQALGLAFTVSTLALAASLSAVGAFAPAQAWQSLLGLVPALLGMWLGQRLRDELSPQAFRRGLFTGLLLLGSWLVWRGWLW